MPATCPELTWWSCTWRGWWRTARPAHCGPTDGSRSDPQWRLSWRAAGTPQPAEWPGELPLHGLHWRGSQRSSPSYLWGKNIWLYVLLYYRVLQYFEIPDDHNSCFKVTLTDITAVQRRSRPLRRSGVAHLVVDNQVDAATHSVVGEVWQGQSFRYNPLASEGAVTMDLRTGELLSENSGFFHAISLAFLEFVRNHPWNTKLWTSTVCTDSLHEFANLWVPLLY